MQASRNHSGCETSRIHADRAIEGPPRPPSATVAALVRTEFTGTRVLATAASVTAGNGCSFWSSNARQRLGGPGALQGGD